MCSVFKQANCFCHFRDFFAWKFKISQSIHLVHYKWHSCTGTPSLFWLVCWNPMYFFHDRTKLKEIGVDMTGITRLWWRLLCYSLLEHFHSAISQQWWTIKRICLGQFICDCLLETLNWHSSYWFLVLLILLHLLRLQKGRPVCTISFSESNYKFQEGLMFFGTLLALQNHQNILNAIPVGMHVWKCIYWAASAALPLHPSIVCTIFTSVLGICSHILSCYSTFTVS